MGGELCSPRRDLPRPPADTSAGEMEMVRKLRKRHAPATARALPTHITRRSHGIVPA